MKSMRTQKLKSYSDNRGCLVENTLEEMMAQARHFFVSKSKPGVVRGNHYHNNKIEWFYIIQGSALIVTEDIKTQEREELQIHAQDNLIVQMVPHVAHAMKNTGNEEMILLAIINVTHDQKNPDTYHYLVLE